MSLGEFFSLLSIIIYQSINRTFWFYRFLCVCVIHNKSRISFLSSSMFFSSFHRSGTTKFHYNNSILWWWWFNSLFVCFWLGLIFHTNLFEIRRYKQVGVGIVVVNPYSICSFGIEINFAIWSDEFFFHQTNLSIWKKRLIHCRMDRKFFYFTFAKYFLRGFVESFIFRANLLFFFVVYQILAHPLFVNIDYDDCCCWFLLCVMFVFQILLNHYFLSFGE